MRLLERLKDTVSQQNTTTSTTTYVPPSDIYDLLSNERRRLIIEYLGTMEGKSTNAAEISDHLESLGDDRTSAYISCTQQHLPRLFQSGVIEYSQQSKEVKLRPELFTIYHAHQAVESILD